MNTTITTKSEQGGNPDQQNHDPQLHRQNFRTQTQKSTQFFFHQLRREKTQRRSTITQRQNSNPYFLASNTKLNIDFLMLSKKPNSKLKSQIDEQNPRSETTNSHGFREKERERERVGFSAKVEREKAGFSV